MKPTLKIQVIPDAVWTATRKAAKRGFTFRGHRVTSFRGFSRLPDDVRRAYYAELEKNLKNP